jgi:hypothetical protein
MALVATFCEFFGCGGGGGPNPNPGDVPGKLVSDYEGEWLYIDGVEYGGFVFGPDRVFRTASPTPPTTGVAYFMSSPTHNEVAIAAATYGYENDDCILTIWAQTLMDGATVIEPRPGDFADLDGQDGRWRILSSKRVMDGAQYRCMARKSVL